MVVDTDNGEITDAALDVLHLRMLACSGESDIEKAHSSADAVLVELVEWMTCDGAYNRSIVYEILAVYRSLERWCA